MKTRKDVLGTVALLGALTVSMSAEYHLAVAAGFGTYVAAALPISVDVYALKAFRVKRDVGAVVTLMVMLNAVSHLLSAGVLKVNTPLIIGVSAVAPMVLWRVHRLGHDAEANAAPAEVNAAPERQVDTPAHTEPARPEPPTPKPLVICGGHRVFTPAVPPAAKVLTLAAETDIHRAEVTAKADTPDAGVNTGERLDTEAARAEIEKAFTQGLPIREAARRATRSPAYVSKVYASMKEAA